MLYTVASVDWSPDRPLTPANARGGLFRWRSEAETIAGGRPTLAVALRYDATRGVVVPEGAVARARIGSWTAPAVIDARGSLTVLGPIPSTLVRVVGPAELRVHPGASQAVARPHVAPLPPFAAGIVRRPAPLPPRSPRGGVQGPG